MEILLTNDDGIYSEGIYALFASLKKFANVTVVAPDSEKSSVGHGITLSHPIWYKKVIRKGKFFGYGITGTPADCVKFAVSVILKRKPDLVVSGINLGPNDGCSVFYSGTVAGAREGALMGIPAMAVSLATFVNPDYRAGARYTAKIIRKLRTTSMPKGTFLNINVPHVDSSRIRGVQVAAQGRTPIHGTFHKRRDPNQREYFWMTGRLPRQTKTLSTDTAALSQNYVTISPIMSDSTDYLFLNTMEGVSF